jgi:hypothetical protein
LRQKVYLKDSLFCVSPKRRSPNADIRSSEESDCAESSVVHENLQGLWKQKRSYGDEMPQVSQQEPALEEERTSKVDALLFIFSYLFDYWRVDSAAFDC